MYIHPITKVYSWIKAVRDRMIWLSKLGIHHRDPKSLIQLAICKASVAMSPFLGEDHMVFHQ